MECTGSDRVYSKNHNVSSSKAIITLENGQSRNKDDSNAAVEDANVNEETIHNSHVNFGGN